METYWALNATVFLALSLCFLQCTFGAEHCQSSCEQDKECVKQESDCYQDVWEPEHQERTTLWDKYAEMYTLTLKFFLTIALATVIFIVGVILYVRLKERELETAHAFQAIDVTWNYLEN